MVGLRPFRRINYLELCGMSNVQLIIALSNWPAEFERKRVIGQNGMKRLFPGKPI
jgi:hypothetical protein